MSFRLLEDIAEEAYHYLYPLVVMEATKRQLRVVTTPKNDDPRNLFVHQMNTATDKWRSVARPNIDTLFSAAWVDLSVGPAMLTLPPAGDRYHMFQMLDFWTDTFAVPGSRSSGPDGITAKVIGPGWESARETNDGEDTVIFCPTPTMWVLGRTAAHSSDDLEKAREFVRACSIVSMNDGTFADEPSSLSDAERKTAPVAFVDAMSPTEFFETAAALLWREGPHGADGSVLMRLRDLGIERGRIFVFADQATEVQAALTAAVPAGRAAILEAGRRRDRFVNGWSYSTENIGTWGNNYVRRALVARWGIAANPAEDAVYLQPRADAEGNPINGGNQHVIHFEPGGTPPAKAFWSLTVYDRNGFLIANDLNRFGIRSRDDVRYNTDGSLDIYLGPECADPHGDSNWIPTIAGPLDMSMRLYMPENEFLTGQWTPPPIRRTNAS